MIGNNIIELSETGSTNDFLEALSQGQNLEDGTVVFALHQKEGKGLGTNRWISEAGQNLTCSFLLKPVFLHAMDQFFLNIMMSLSVCDLVREMLSGLIEPERIRIKWPNDIYIDDKKVSGILIRNTISGEYSDQSILGVGINLNQVEFPPDLPNPVSLKSHTGTTCDIAKTMDLLCRHLEIRYRQLMDGKKQVLLNDYLECLFRKGIWCKYSAGRQVFDGRIHGVSSSGQLMVETSSGQMLEFGFREIRMLIESQEAEGQSWL